VRITSGEGSYI